MSRTKGATGARKGWVIAFSESDKEQGGPAVLQAAPEGLYLRFEEATAFVKWRRLKGWLLEEGGATVVTKREPKEEWPRS